MFSSLKNARDEVESQVSSCALRQNAFSNCRRELRAQAKADLSRPGTLAGAFAVGAYLGSRRGSSGATREEPAERVDLKESLASAEELMEKVVDKLSQAEQDISSARGKDAGAEGASAADIATTLVTSVVTRVFASLAIEQVEKMRQGDGVAPSPDTG